MKRKYSFSIITLFALLAPLHSQTEEHEFIRSQWLTESVLIVRYGHLNDNSDMVVAVNTEKGIVVIDSGMSPSLTEKYRAHIEKQFGRSDFRYVINTHHHDDHINGNQVFKDVEIIAHQNAGKRMTEDLAGNDAYLKRVRERTNHFYELKETLGKTADLYKRIEEYNYPFKKMLDDYESVFKLTLPSITFNDALILDMGNLTIELVYFGPDFHTDNDILISIPEENVVFTGDLLRQTNQYSQIGSKSKFNPWISALEKIFRNNSDVEHVVAYHEGVLPGSVLSDFYNSLKKMRNDQQQKASAVDRLRTWILGMSLPEAVTKFENQYLKNKNEEYFVWEGDMLSLAREHQAKEKLDDSIIILNLCEKIFPSSTTVLFQQGSVYTALGKKQQALEAYNRILRMDPHNLHAVYRIYLLDR